MSVTVATIDMSVGVSMCNSRCTDVLPTVTAIVNI